MGIGICAATSAELLPFDVSEAKCCSGELLVPTHAETLSPFSAIRRQLSLKVKSNPMLRHRLKRYTSPYLRFLSPLNQGTSLPLVRGLLPQEQPASTMGIVNLTPETYHSTGTKSVAYRLPCFKLFIKSYCRHLKRGGRIMLALSDLKCYRRQKAPPWIHNATLCRKLARDRSRPARNRRTSLIFGDLGLIPRPQSTTTGPLA